MSNSNEGDYYEVVQGENLTLIALRFGFADHKPIYDHPNNADFKRNRPNPDLLHPGDRIFIPKVRLREQSCATGKCHPFVLKWPKKVLRITLEDSDGKAISDAPYELTLDPPPSDWSSRITPRRHRTKHKKTVRGKTDSDGRLEQPVAINAARAKLKIGNLVWQVAIGHLNPADREHTPDNGISGIQARLRNLGFYSGKVDGIVGPRTKQAIRAFQEKHQKEVDADKTGSTETLSLSKLNEQHKS